MVKRVSIALLVSADMATVDHGPLAVQYGTPYIEIPEFVPEMWYDKGIYRIHKYRRASTPDSEIMVYVHCDSWDQKTPEVDDAGRVVL